MSWFKPTPPKYPVEMRVPKVEFIGEQDGSPEQLLKEHLIEFFHRDKNVHKAYLAKVNIGNQAGVALCLKTQFGPDRGLAEKIGTIFKTIFNAQAHLDIMFLNPHQEAEVARVCKTFFG
jgi:hypothetical protein